MLERPTPRCNIGVHLDTYRQLKLICQKTGMTFDHVIRVLLDRRLRLPDESAFAQEDP